MPMGNIGSSKILINAAKNISDGIKIVVSAYLSRD